MSSAVPVDDRCVEVYNEMKIKKTQKFLIYKIENEKIIIEYQGDPSESYDDFKVKLPENEPRYCVVDFDYSTDDGRPQNKLLFVFWSPDTSKVKDKMVYASSLDNIKKKLNGIAKVVQANDPSEVDRDEVTKLMK